MGDPVIVRDLLAAWSLAALLLLCGVAGAAGQPAADFVQPQPRARCPVCGMFVEPFPAWWAQVVFADGSREVFDGVKDLVRYLGDRQRYTPGRAGVPVAHIWVTDYYAVRPIPAETAHFVAGSDVLGPMGNEFIPFAVRAEAEEFLRDHRGATILGFADLPAYPLEEASGQRRP